jgi:hypothetical protein
MHQATLTEVAFFRGIAVVADLGTVATEGAVKVKKAIADDAFHAVTKVEDFGRCIYLLFNTMARIGVHLL